MLNVTASATPPCPHFGPCGGCQLQHLTYSAQLDLKAADLRGLLAPTGLTLPALQLHASPPLGYRNRIRLTLGRIEGELRAGYIRATDGCPTSGGPPRDPGFLPPPLGSDAAFLPITQCPIAAPILWRAADAFLALANQMSWLTQIPDQIELFTAADESRLQFTLYMRSPAKGVPTGLTGTFNALCDKLQASIPELTGAGIALLPPASKDRSRRLELPRPGPSWGAPGLKYPVGDTSYWVPRGAFFQTNRFLVPELLKLVTANRTGALAWDLYAGVGLFSRALAGSFAEVVAVEIAEPAASALAATKLANLHAVKATTLDFLRAAVLQRERPDLIVLDPPRTGAGPEVCELLGRIAAPTLVYVSCAPQILPGDLVPLAAAGYSVAELHLVDLFPQTTHIETVAVLRR